MLPLNSQKVAHGERLYYDPDFRQKVVEDIKKNNLTYGQAGLKYGVAKPTIGRWYREIIGIRNGDVSRAVRHSMKLRRLHE